MSPATAWPGSSGISAAATIRTRSRPPSACATRPRSSSSAPTGAIIAKDLQGDAIKQAVARALAAQPPAQPQQGAAGPPRADRKLDLEVVNAADNTPLAGASVWACVYRGQEQIAQGTTDGEGRHAIPMSGRPARYVEVVVAHPGFVPAAMSWWEWGRSPTG